MKSHIKEFTIKPDFMKTYIVYWLPFFDQVTQELPTGRSVNLKSFFLETPCTLVKIDSNTTFNLADFQPF